MNNLHAALTQMYRGQAILVEHTDLSLIEQGNRHRITERNHESISIWRSPVYLDAGPSCLNQHIGRFLALSFEI